MFSAECSNQTAEDHVNGGGVEGGGDEDEDGLNDEAADGILVIVRPYSTAVTDSLDWRQWC